MNAPNFFFFYPKEKKSCEATHNRDGTQENSTTNRRLNGKRRHTFKIKFRGQKNVNEF